MTQSLRDQLLGLGFKPAPKPERNPDSKPGSRLESKNTKRGGGKSRPGDAENRRSSASKNKAPKRGGGEHGSRSPGKRDDIDLAKAYAIRAQREKEERIAAEAAKQEAARLRREARAKLHALLQGRALNREDAEIARHFEYGGKIKRIYVTAEQLKELNAGKLGVVQDNGRYLLVDAATMAEAEAVFEAAIALRIDPNAPASDDPYADPKFQVPDDLVW